MDVFALSSLLKVHGTLMNGYFS